MGLAGWLRRNSERYLLEAAQREMAARHGRPPPVGPRGPAALFWRRLFVPVYRALPWGLRRWVMQLMPGSHRRGWRDRAPPAALGTAAQGER